MSGLLATNPEQHHDQSETQQAHTDAVELCYAFEETG
jgi:hypothetical protein